MASGAPGLLSLGPFLVAGEECRRRGQRGGGPQGHGPHEDRAHGAVASPAPHATKGLSGGPRSRDEDLETLATERGPQGPLRSLKLSPPWRRPKHLRIFMDRSKTPQGWTSLELSTRHCRVHFDPFWRAVGRTKSSWRPTGSPSAGTPTGRRPRGGPRPCRPVDITSLLSGRMAPPAPR